MSNSQKLLKKNFHVWFYHKKKNEKMSTIIKINKKFIYFKLFNIYMIELNKWNVLRVINKK